MLMPKYLQFLPPVLAGPNEMVHQQRLALVCRPYCEPSACPFSAGCALLRRAFDRCQLACCHWLCCWLTMPHLTQHPPGLLCRSTRQALLDLGQRLIADGLRVLAVAVRELPSVADALAAASIAYDSRSGAASGNASPRSPFLESSSPVASGTGKLAGGNGGEASPRSPPTPAGRQRAASPFGGSVASLASIGVSFSAKDEADMRFVGFLAFLDPPKETARQAVAELRAKSGQRAYPPCLHVQECLGPSQQVSLLHSLGSAAACNILSRREGRSKKAAARCVTFRVPFPPAFEPQWP